MLAASIPLAEADVANMFEYMGQWQPTSLFKGAGGMSLTRPSSACIGS